MADAPGICQALNHDALEEVASHCSVNTLLNLQQTCTSFSQLLAGSEKVWFRRLAEDFGLHLKALPSRDPVFVRLARTVYEAARTRALRFQGVLVTGGVDEDAMQYWVDNMFKPDKAPYCCNCSYNADCLALLLDGEVPRDVEYERVRRYVVRRCRYAAALIMNVQLPQQDRDPDAMMNILEDWTDAQLESFFRDLVAALNQGHALGRLLVYDVEHDRVPTEQQRIVAVEKYLRDRLEVMKKSMIKLPGRPNTMLDPTVVEKLQDPARSNMAGVVNELTLSREGSLTCPVSSGVVLLGHMDYAMLAGMTPEQVARELEAATQDPECTKFNFLSTSEQVEAAAAAGHIPPIAVTEQNLSGIWHEFATQPEQLAQQAEHAQQPWEGAAGQGQPSAAATAGTSAAGAWHAVMAARPQEERANGAHARVPAAAAAAVVGLGGGGGGGPAAAAAAVAAGHPPLLLHPAPPNAAPVAAAAAAAALAAPPPPAAAPPGAPAAEQPQQLPRLPPPSKHALHPPFNPTHAPSAATPLQGRLVKWRPLLWFHFHSYDDCVEFVRRYHSLLAATAPRFGSATVRHRGPPTAASDTLHLPSFKAQQAAGRRGPLDPWTQQQQQRRRPPQAPWPAWTDDGGEAGPSTSAAAAAAAGGGPSGLQHTHAFFPQQQQQQQHAVWGQPAVAAATSQSAAAAGHAAAGQAGPYPGDGAAGASGNDASAGPSHHVQQAGEDLEERLVVDEGMSDSEGDDFGGGSSMGDEEEDGLLEDGMPAAHAMPAAGELEEDDEDMLDNEAGSEDDEPQLSQNIAAFYNAVAAAAVQSAGGVTAAEAIADLRARPSLGLVTKRSTRRRNKLHVPLSRPCSGNVVLVKLINQENLMHFFQDQHSWPNIDMAYVGITGKAVSLPSGISLQV